MTLGKTFHRVYQPVITAPMLDIHL